MVQEVAEIKLLEFWPKLKIIHVSRNLRYVVQSRVIRGYQKDVASALNVCYERLNEAYRMYQKLDSSTLLNIKIEQCCFSPSDSLFEICKFIDAEPNEKAVNLMHSINYNHLISLGDPVNRFYKKDIDMIDRVRKEFNTKFGSEII